MNQDAERLTVIETLNDDYDSPWKEAVEHYFPEFMAFYFPDASARMAQWERSYNLTTYKNLLIYCNDI